MKFVKIMLSVYRLPSTAAEVRRRKSEDIIKNGFTLAEILIVMAIVAIVGTILVTIFTNTLRGSNKAQALAVIKQNGQAVLENMDKTIRNSDNVVCPTTASGNTVVIEKSGTYTRYRIVLPTDSDSLAPASCSEGCILWDNPVKQVVLGAEETDAQFIASVCLPVSSMSSAQILTDTNAQSGVKIDSGSFTVNWSSGYKPSVSVNFELSPGVGVGAAVSSQIEPVTFQTTIQLR